MYRLTLLWMLSATLICIAMVSLYFMSSEAIFWSQSTGVTTSVGEWQTQLAVPSHTFPSMGSWKARHFKDNIWTVFFYSNLSVRYKEVEAKDASSACTTKLPSEKCFAWLAQYSSKDTTPITLEGVTTAWPQIKFLGHSPHQEWHLGLFKGAMLGTENRDLVIRGAWNDTLSTKGKWIGLGYSGYNTKMRSMFPTKDSNDSYYPLAMKYFEGTLNSTEAVQLFERVYSNSSKVRNTSDAKNAKSNENENILNYESMFSSLCVWLASINSSDSHKTQGLMWSSCGDSFSWVSSTKTYIDWTWRTNGSFAILFIFQAIPMLWGFWDQLEWIRNSRTRTLRVNSFQILWILFWSAFYGKALRVASSLALLSEKILSLIGAVNVLSESLLFILYSNIYHESQQYWNGDDNQVNMSFLHVFFAVQNGYLIWDVLSGALTSAWFLGAFVLLFWLPQIIHFFFMDGWAGLTTSFIVGSGSLALVPMTLVVIFKQEPWELPRNFVAHLTLAMFFFSLVSIVLVALRLKGGGNLLPNRLAPWRHVYETTVDAQRMELQENPLCSICRNNLSDGWDDSDALWRTPCNHLFHKSCLLRWMEESQDCPLCRRLLPST